MAYRDNFYLPAAAVICSLSKDFNLVLKHQIVLRPVLTIFWHSQYKEYLPFTVVVKS